VKGMNLDDVMSEKSYELFQTYAQSKLANILFTKELQKRCAIFATVVSVMYCVDSLHLSQTERYRIKD
jgi:hypothetical protein